ncbi:MAG TPA: hypothetical protein VH088_12455 [Terriglobales bacterium]|nr:hypothetical protein [Terriglobales bacterium]
MKKILATIVATLCLAMVAMAAPKDGSWTGYVSDAKCGAKVDAACAKKCADSGEARVFVNDTDKSVLKVSNQDALKGHEGHHVKVNGSVDGDTLTVASVSMVQ